MDISLNLYVDSGNETDILGKSLVMQYIRYILCT